MFYSHYFSKLSSVSSLLRPQLTGVDAPLHVKMEDAADKMMLLLPASVQTVGQDITVTSPEFLVRQLLAREVFSFSKVFIFCLRVTAPEKQFKLHFSFNP